MVSFLWRINPRESRFEKFEAICERTSCDDKHTAKRQTLWSEWEEASVFKSTLTQWEPLHSCLLLCERPHTLTQEVPVLVASPNTCKLWLPGLDSSFFIIQDISWKRLVCTWRGGENLPRVTCDLHLLCPWKGLLVDTDTKDRDSRDCKHEWVN